MERRFNYKQLQSNRTHNQWRCRTSGTRGRHQRLRLVLWAAHVSHLSLNRPSTQTHTWFISSLLVSWFSNPHVFIPLCLKSVHFHEDDGQSKQPGHSQLGIILLLHAGPWSENPRMCLCSGKRKKMNYWKMHDACGFVRDHLNCGWKPGSWKACYLIHGINFWRRSGFVWRTPSHLASRHRGFRAPTDGKAPVWFI